MIVGTKYKEDLLKDSYDDIIIGSGISGLACASFLAQNGHKVLVLEKHYTAGGYTHTFKRAGVEWDVGVHYVGEFHHGPSLLARIFKKISGGGVEWAEMGDIYDKMVFPDGEYAFHKGKEQFVNKLVEKFPSERSAIEAYVHHIGKASKSFRSHYSKRMLPRFFKPLLSPFIGRAFKKYGSVTTWDFMKRLTDNEKLIAVLCGQFGDYGLPPKKSSFVIHAMVANHYIHGASYPVGGSSVMAAESVKVIEKQGGQVLTNAGVESILREGEKVVGVRLENGKAIKAKRVISSTGINLTFNHLIKDWEGSKKYQEIIKRTPLSTGHICIYISLDKTAEELNLSKTNLWVYSSYDQDKAIQDYIDNPEGEVPLAYLSFPSAKDPDFQKNYPGKGTIEIVGLCPWDWFDQWQDEPWRKRGEDYNELKEKLARPYLEILYKQCPQVKDHIAYYEISTPLSTKTFCQYEKGEVYGLDFNVSRFYEEDLKPTTDLENFYLTGQDIFTNGVAGAMASGWITAATVMRKNPLSLID